ncbi:aldehyde dehydrogenase family protein [Lysobacter silvisoli]|uniref:Aldehyde dehydrogenase family protein n=1 Tax=Lysobacter silvisoli TaxID=2293254 RepID=A0A371JY39_9GAMM|nr:aldehyde dehydrogenase family protein [Lysobacter silvisoli]RDZ26522.1 aldehyde dehydrogenase family protein [Lysobacter silvisoli]
MEPILIAGQWQPSRDPVGGFRAVAPGSGEAIGPEFPRSGPQDLEAALAAASAIADELAAAAPARIADFLDAYATGIEAAADALVATAHAETALPTAPRLSAVELPRTCNQLRQAAAAVRAYAWTHPVIDTQAGLRAHYAPLHKPVLIFGPNNFPFAFNAVAGSDFASSLAARNPVIAKAHPSHPATSALLARIAHAALLANDLPAAAVQLLYDFDSERGLRLAGDRRLGAIGFTGSRAGGMALKAAADRAGIPIYAEMSSVNPVFLLPGALRERGDALAQEFFASCTLGSGQFCTNPGVVAVSAGADGDAFVAAAAQRFADAAPAVLFSQGVQRHLADAVERLRAAGAQVVAGAAQSAGPGARYAPTLLTVDTDSFVAAADALQEEAFGPVSLLVRYRDTTEAVAVARAFDGNLTGSLHSAADGSDDAAYARIAAALRPRVGRLIDDKWPTGVAVSPAMQHGGPYPSTSHAGFTSVGMPAAIRRYAQLHSYDQVRDDRLPAELRDANPGKVQRCIDGVWTVADVARA